MNRYYFLILIIFIFNSCENKDTKKKLLLNRKEILLIENIFKDTNDYCRNFNILNTKIRDSKIIRKTALIELKSLMPKINKIFFEKFKRDTLKEKLKFPLEDYSYNAIGGNNGSGYVVGKYNYFDGNKHSGHPAHDIFIKDYNQDVIDDDSKNKVNVLTITSGIVVALEDKWDSLSNLRGGKYIYIYNANYNCLFYYAHNDTLLVKIGDVLKVGDKIAKVGRTGSNAFKKRSPTHLHLMVLKFDKDYYPRPINLYKELIN